jgi:dUTP pyrophosphatase
MVALHNHSATEQTVSDGERIAQIVFTPYETASFSVVDELDSTIRGEGGFGSTGK